jgi:hypothetical protein
MAIWFSKSLGDGMTAGESSAEIENPFLPLFSAAGSPPDMAVFTRFNPEGRLQFEVTTFFSTAAAELAKMFDVQPCVKPPRDGLILLEGDERCWAALFPENKKQRAE